VGDLGDPRTYSGLFEVDGTGKVLAAPSSGAAVGSEVSLDQIPGALQTGTVAGLMLLEQSANGYRVVRLFPAQQEIR